MGKDKDLEDLKDTLKEMSQELNPLEFLLALADGAAFCKKAEKLQAKLNKKLDKMVEDGEIDEHEARWKYYIEYEEFTTEESRKTTERLASLTKIDNEEVEEDDDDAEDESCDCDDEDEDDARQRVFPETAEERAHRKALEELKKILGDSDGDGLSFDVRGDVYRRKLRD